MILRGLLVIVTGGALACSSKDAPRTDTGSGLSPTGDPMDAPRQDFKIVEDVPDEPGWHTAVTVLVNGWTPSFNKLGLTEVKVSAVKAPDGSVAKYVMKAEGKKGTEVTFRGGGMVSRGTQLNSGGLKKLEEHFYALGFPKTTQMHIGHLIMELQLTIAIDAAWLVLPETIDWKYDAPLGPNNQVPATLIYDERGALLTLYRDNKTTPSTVERLEVRIDKDGLVTKTATFRASGSTTWQPIP